MPAQGRTGTMFEITAELRQHVSGHVSSIINTIQQFPFMNDFSQNIFASGTNTSIQMMYNNLEIETLSLIAG